jgi:tetratricopeptide (TPR) repeat protein
VRFCVIDKGVSGTDTPVILRQVESYLAEYRPDMVVAMMGINDKKDTYYEDMPKSGAWFFRHCRVYRFGRILYMQLLKELQRKDVYGLGGSDSGRKAQPEGTWTIAEKTAFANEIPTEKAAPPDSESQKGSPGSNHRLSETEKPLNAIAFEPKTDNDYIGLGQRLYHEEGKSLEAEASFIKAIELNPENDQAHIELGQLYQVRGKYSEAEAAFQRALEINPKNDRAYVDLAWLYATRGRDKRQIEDFFWKAIEINPKNDMACINLGSFYEYQGRFSQAEDAFKKAIGINPKNSTTYFRLGGLYRAQGKLSQAEDTFKKVIELDPKKENMLVTMASIYEEMGKPELAKAYADKANKLGSERYSAITVNNYHKLKEILDRKGIRLICVQYPMRNVDPLKRIFGKDEGVVFIDNEQVFKKAVRQSGYKEYFTDMFAGDFGHCTQKGNELLAQNIADVILKEVFNK